MANSAILEGILVSLFLYLMNVFGVISKIFSARILIVNPVTAKTFTNNSFEF
jgi:hypothetical protein